jgi:hypothetical protein
MNKEHVVYIYNDILLSLKKNSDKCYSMNFEYIMLSEISQPQKDYYMISLILEVKSIAAEVQ